MGSVFKQPLRQAAKRYMKVGRRASIKLFGERKKKKSTHAHLVIVSSTHAIT
jgi:hypothetical protein